MINCTWDSVRHYSSHYIELIWCLAALKLMHCSPEMSGSDLQCRIHITKPKYEYKYIQDGDIIIGGVFTMNQGVKYVPNGPFRSVPFCFQPFIENYEEIYTFLFAIDEINKNPDLLPNITLGYHVYDSCLDPRIAIGSVLQILSGPGNVVPNYSCRDQGEIAGFIGDQSSVPSLPIAQLLGLYGYAQISYGATNPILRDKEFFPYFLSTGVNDHIQHVAIAKLLEHFGWTWVIIVAVDDDSGDSQNLQNEIIKHGACVASFITLTEDSSNNRMKLERVKQSTAEVIVFCGVPSAPIFQLMYKIGKLIEEKTLVIPVIWYSHLISIVSLYNGSINFDENVNKKEILLNNFNEYVSSVREDPLLTDLMAMYLKCWTPDQEKNSLFREIYGIFKRNCTGHLWRLVSPENKVYISVYTMAHALNNLLSLLGKHTQKDIHRNIFRNQLHYYFRNLYFVDPWGREIEYDKDGDVSVHLLIRNWIYSFQWGIIITNVGEFSWSESEGNLKINSKKITWKKNTNNTTLKSQCSANCPHGHQKIPWEGAPPCCYGCAPCSEGEVSNITDAENCLKCPDNQWPNKDKTVCIEKQIEFLSYDDSLAVVFIAIILFLFLIATLTLAIFIVFRHTPIVKANNRNLSYILLVSIKLSFLSVFLFLGHPVDITCMLRETSFGITFSISVSCVLAKTIMVYIAFKNTKPGNSWRKWLGAKLANCIALVVSFIQLLICITWLAVSPPFMELNTFSEPGKIIIECNEGSVVAFYIVLSYMGLLASVSFIVAFLARSLPDSFNEAKYITFSMLLFCSVWITMIPAYLSTKGKYMVAVEIFAVTSSNCGLLFCIFLPKCYIILFQPEINSKQYLMMSQNKYVSYNYR
ncbi:hypothetical protein XELAEV_18004932mg [Xenopus laevis]|uniref:G-protein coupled receptors family 3 profile domain-containing protein n=1 Tax=Xenopus laevis TaxID=8355 RepID=A0A974DY66_XENLA|nr:hypothetical protein XELAEV_18004932mg [Xenopus laevis]